MAFNEKEYTFEDHVDFNDKYFPRVDIKDRERYYPIYKYNDKEFTYDKKDKLVIFLFKDDEEIENMGKNKAPWREMETAGLREENWKNKAARDEYLHEFCFDLDSETEELIAQAKSEFGIKEQVTEEVDNDGVVLVTAEPKWFHSLNETAKKLLVLVDAGIIDVEYILEAVVEQLDEQTLYNMMKNGTIFNLDEIELPKYKLKNEKNESLNEVLTVVHDELNPVIWDNGMLKSEIKEKILALVEEFQSTLDVPLHVLDIEIVGSNASYNYTDKSDVDVHIITNFDDYGYPQEFIQAAMNSFKANFNKAYDVDYKGFNVELYVENVNSTPTTNGVYSVLQDKWIKEPQKLESIEVELEPTLTEYRQKIDSALKSDSAEEINAIIDELYVMRRNSLLVDGETGAGNLIFKQIRNDGLLDGLKNKKIELRSNELSVESLKEDTNEDNKLFAAKIHSTMQDRTFYIIGKNENYVVDAYNLFIQALNQPSDEHNFEFLDEYVESHGLVLIDNDYKAEEIDRTTIRNTETGEVYNINIIKDYSSRF